MASHADIDELVRTSAWEAIVYIAHVYFMLDCHPHPTSGPCSGLLNFSVKIKKLDIQDKALYTQCSYVLARLLLSYFSFLCAASA